MKLRKFHRQVQELEVRPRDRERTQSYFEFPSRHQSLKDGLLKSRAFLRSSARVLSRPVDFTWIVFLSMAEDIYDQFKHQPHPCFEHGSASPEREYFAFDVP